MHETCLCDDCIEYSAIIGAELREYITKTDLKKLTDKEIDRIIKRYRLPVPGGVRDATRTVKIRHIVKAASNYGNVYPFDKYNKTPTGLKKRIDMLGKDFTWKMYNNAMKLTGSTLGVEYLEWVTRPDLSKTGPCPICQPRNGVLYKASGFLPDCPAHMGCVCEWRIVYRET